jgi:putative PIG3 family NAD(P)H quinone oxidoreductase
MFGMVIEGNSLRYDDTLETPEPAAGEVLIKTAYAGVNRADLFQIAGHYPPPEGASPLPGLEVSGEIVAIGEGVKEWGIGQPVCALLEGGGYGEYARVAASQILAVPTGWSMAEAAALPEALFTVWLALFHTAQLQAGGTVLIHGGASGIGSLASQMVAAAGAKSVTTASSAEKCEFSKKQGAEKAICYKEEDFVEVIKRDYGGVDIVLDIVGGSYIARNLKVLKPYGRMISLAFLESAQIEISAAALLMKQLRWQGVTLRSRSREQKAHLCQEIETHCGEWLAQRRILPAIDSEYPLKQADEALKRMEQNLNFGKILLKA